ncbi:cell division protein ZipA C-terminal FtsZ-binding domain-containing protein [Methylobacter sp. YRD-M1]|uniref:cell division protein ZipA C-terminal FtsZ-binding domain-containing protein n=1 Tax=Methylobacter sp. YRD-M1 TaxID=2911520 RepID=UPI00227D4675|nr:cell division protein ZipA C-terminal FtsZ-binding domain-containing protein [Methylobacter sp. YRD-M1]WAK03551.1 cell division protein ZipA C-terminal FtsZ-binding domain-containing protein [Methylobacter sp. YRD-M1]
MDKEILRIVIIATGLLVIIGMLLWAYVRNRKAQHDMGGYEGEDILKGADEALAFQEDDDDFDVASFDKRGAHAAKSEQYESDDDYYESDDEDYDEPQSRFVAPKIIQFSLIARDEEGFNGVDLVNALEMVGLEYGSLKIFERLDANRLVDFGVASMVESGTFPSKNLDTFYTPGIVFFMQPEAVDNAQAVFDDYVQTIQLLASELNGVIRDHQRQPLTEATIQMIRQSL